MGYIDQVKALLDGLKNNPTSRRHIISAWHPDWSISQSALPECHILQQYNIQGNNLNSIVYIRSQDLPYGCPYNMMGYGLLLHIYAKYLNLIPNELILMLGDTHIYNNQIPFVTKQVLRTPKQLPKLAIYKELNTFEDIISLEFWDMELIGYDPHPDFKNKPAMAV
jgi:thymidylate synthase